MMMMVILMMMMTMMMRWECFCRSGGRSGALRERRPERSSERCDQGKDVGDYRCNTCFAMPWRRGLQVGARPARTRPIWGAAEDKATDRLTAPAPARAAGALGIPARWLMDASLACARAGAEVVSLSSLCQIAFCGSPYGAPPCWPPADLEFSASRSKCCSCSRPHPSAEHTFRDSTPEDALEPRGGSCRARGRARGCSAERP